MGSNRVKPNEPEIANHRPVTDNSVNALLTSAGSNSVRGVQLHDQ